MAQENAQKLLPTKPTVTICTSSSPDSNLPAWAALHHSHASIMGAGPSHPFTDSSEASGGSSGEHHVPSGTVARNSELNQSSLCHQMKDTPRQKGRQREYSGEESKAMKPRTARDGGRQSKAGRPRQALLRKSSTSCLQELTEKPK